jgi:hypothetical protein
MQVRNGHSAILFILLIMSKNAFRVVGLSSVGRAKEDVFRGK